MASRRSAAEYVPEHADLDGLRAAAAGCQGCDLYRDATQTVFGAGPASARCLLLGEQPGDREDVTGTPFVGPAGRLLDRALAQAGFDRDEVYLTNAVKHFKFTQAGRGGRRIHKAPTMGEITACRPWLLAELRVVRPRIVVCLGATAGRALFGSTFRVGEQRGRLLPFPEDLVEVVGTPPPRVLATIHPSAVLRAGQGAGGEEAREAAYQGLVADLAVAAGV